MSQIHILRFRQNPIRMSNSLSLIDVRELARLGLLAYHRYAIWVALSDAISLVFTLLYRRIRGEGRGHHVPKSGLVFL